MIDDRRLQHDVLAALDASDIVDSQAISVTAHDGIVTLAGFVPLAAQKDAAEHQALSVAGVKALVESIVVRSAINPGVADDEVARRIADLFRWSVTVPDDLAIKVEDGWVTLSGMVDTPRQREQANRLAAQVHGAHGVINMIAVRNHAPNADVQRHIVEALRRQADTDAQSITVTTEKGQLVVRGEVAGWLERTIAGNVALSASGAGAMRNDIIVRLPPGGCTGGQSASFVADGC